MRVAWKRLMRSPYLKTASRKFLVDHAQEGTLVDESTFCRVHKREVSVEAPESMAHGRAFEGVASICSAVLVIGCS